MKKMLASASLVAAAFGLGACASSGTSRPSAKPTATTTASSAPAAGSSALPWGCQGCPLPPGTPTNVALGAPHHGTIWTDAQDEQFYEGFLRGARLGGDPTTKFDRQCIIDEAEFYFPDPNTAATAYTPDQRQAIGTRIGTLCAAG